VGFLGLVSWLFGWFLSLSFPSLLSFQGLTLARQVLYHLSHCTSPFLVFIFHQTKSIWFRWVSVLHTLTQNNKLILDIWELVSSLHQYHQKILSRPNSDFQTMDTMFHSNVLSISLGDGLRCSNTTVTIKGLKMILISTQIYGHHQQWPLSRTSRTSLQWVCCVSCILLRPPEGMSRVGIRPGSPGVTSVLWSSSPPWWPFSSFCCSVWPWICVPRIWSGHFKDGSMHGNTMWGSRSTLPCVFSLEPHPESIFPSAPPPSALIEGKMVLIPPVSMEESVSSKSKSQVDLELAGPL
jgi:hypothetical protein